MELTSIEKMVKHEYKAPDGYDPKYPEVKISEFVTTSTEHDEYSVVVFDEDGVIDKFNLRISKVPYATLRTLI